MHLSLAHPTNHSRPKLPLSGPALTLVSLKIEGLTPQKQITIAEMVKEQYFKILLLQKTHRGQDQNLLRRRIRMPSLESINTC